jgi:chromosome segregation ATPase
VYRSPWEVIDSLFVRGDLAFQDNPKFAIEVWAAYNRAVLDFATRYSEISLLVHVYALANDENILISKANNKFGLNLPHIQEKVFQKSEIHSQITSTHRPELLVNYFPTALEIYQNLEDKADLPSRLESRQTQRSVTSDDYQDWIFQDWLSSSRLSSQLKHIEAQAQQTQSELHVVRTELAETYTALQETRAELGETYTALQETRAELGETYTALQETRAEAGRLYTDSKRFYEEFQSAKAELECSKQVISAMENSKFWVLRNRWLKLKKPFSKLFSAKAANQQRELEHEQ